MGSRWKVNVRTHIRGPKVIYFFMMGFASALTFLKTMVFAAYLPPLSMGYYSIALTIASYGAFLQLGILSGLNRELPVTLGKGDITYSSNIVGETTVALVCLQLIGICLYYLILLTMPFTDASLRTAFFLGGLLAFSTPLYSLIMVRLRSEQRVLSFAMLALIESMATITLGTLAIVYVGYEAVILLSALINALCFFIVTSKLLAPANYLHFKMKETIYLVRIGLPMMLAGLLANLQLSMDRLFLIKSAPPSTIGIYHIGILPLSMGVALGSIVNQYVGPRLLFKYGQGYSLPYIFKQNIIVSFVIIVTLLLFWPVAYLGIRYVIENWLPQYRGSLSIFSISYFGAIFIAANIGVITSAINRQILSFYTAGLTVSLSYLCYMLVANYSITIRWYAYVNAGSQAVSFVVMIVLSYYLTRKYGAEKRIVPNG